MIDKVILDIAHSDDYTDYLFMTAALTNSRVIPLIDPSAEELRRQSDGNAFIFKCRNSRKALESGGRDSPCGSIFTHHSGAFADLFG